MRDQQASEIAGLLERTGRRLLAQHRLLRMSQPSVLDLCLQHVAGPAAVRQGEIGAWLELMIRAYWACGGQAQTPRARRQLELALASFATSICALEVLDDLVDGDEPAAGRQAPNLALSLLGESMGLLCRLPEGLATRLHAYWSMLWPRCAAAQALDVSLSTAADLTVDQALTVARGSGFVTRWAVEAGGIVAGASADLLAPLADFGQHLGTAEKLLHDLHDLWPSAHPSRDLRRPGCNLTLVVARHMGLFSDTAALDDDTLRRQLLQRGVLHYAWAYADQYRLHAASALDRFAQAGGNPSPLTPVLALSEELRGIQIEDAKL